jgi:CRP/FNR family transcriptional regulator, cyclic AMP receptor protein
MPDENLQKFMKSYSPGTVICREGEEGSEMYIIQKGKVRVSKDIAGRPHLISVLEKGDFFGEMALVSRTPRSATVAAIDAVELLVFDREGLLNTITRNARIALSIIDKLCRRLQAAHQKIQHLVKRDARGLIALHLLQALQQAEGAASALPYTATLEEISLAFEMPMVDARKVLDDMTLEGVLAVEGDTLRVSDRARLAGLADSAGAGPGTAAERGMPGGER